VQRLVPLALVACVAAQLAFVFQYNVTDPSAYFVPGIAVAALSMVPVGGWIAARLPKARALAFAVALAAIAVAAVPLIREALARPAALMQVDQLLLQLWRAVPFEQGIVLWPNGNYTRLKEFQRFRGEKPGIDVYATAVLCNEYPRVVFKRKYGFDPMANNDEAHMALPVNPDFVFGDPGSEFNTRYFALVHRTIVDSAKTSVAGFNAPYGVRVFRSLSIPPPARDSMRH